MGRRQTLRHVHKVSQEGRQRVVQDAAAALRDMPISCMELIPNTDWLPECVSCCCAHTYLAARFASNALKGWPGALTLR